MNDNRSSTNSFGSVEICKTTKQLSDDLRPQRRFHRKRKVRWHRGSGQWVVTIGRVLTENGKLADKDWYFSGTLSQDEANSLATDKAQQWEVICKKWGKGDAPLLRVFGEPFPNDPHWNSGLSAGKKPLLSPGEVAQIAAKNIITREEFIEAMAGYSLAGFINYYIESRQVELNRKEVRHTSVTKLQSQMRAATKFFPEDVPAKDLKKEHFLEARHQMDKQVSSVRTIKNYMSAALTLIRFIYKECMGDISVSPGIADACIVKNATSTDIDLYSLTDLKSFISATKGTISQLDIMLALNCGMYPQDIGRLELSEIDFADGSIFWDREKEPANPFRMHHLFWPETLRLVKLYVNAEAPTLREWLDYRAGPKPVVIDTTRLAFLDQRRPRYWVTPGGHEKDWVSKRFGETVTGVSFRDLRKTANQFFLDMVEGDDSDGELEGAQELSHRFLGQKTATLVRLYRLMGKRAYTRMNKHLEKLGNFFRAEGVFEGVSA